MAQRRCYGCMGLTDQPVCGSCGTPEEEQNLPHQLPRGTSLAGRFLVGKALEELPDGIVYLALDQSRGEPVKLLEFFPADAAHRELGAVEAKGPSFARKKVRFCKVSEALARDSRLTEVSGAELTFEENGTCYRVCEQIRGSTLKKYVEMRDGSLHPEEVFRILTPILEALEVFHKSGFSHGKLDWESIVLDSRGGPRLPRVGDAPGEDPREDVGNLCRIVLSSLGWESKDKRGRVPELTPQQRRVLKIGMSTEPGMGYATAGDLRQALQEAAPRQEPEPIQAAPEPARTPPPPEPVQAPGPAPAPGKRTPPPPKAKKSAGKRPGKGGRYNTGGKIGVLILAAVVLVILAVLAVLLVRNVHVWKDPTCTEAGTCAICGKTEGEPLGHDWREDICTDPKTCARCGETEGEVIGHDWVEATCTEPKTCARCGKTEGEPLGHDWAEATCTEARKCSRCGATEGEPLGHDWVSGGYGKPQVCTRCNQVKCEIIQELKGTYGSRIPLGTVSTYPFEAESPVYFVRSLTLHFRAEIGVGIELKNWKFYYRTPTGDWVFHSNITLTDGKAVETIRFDEPVNIAAVAVVPAGGGFTYEYSIAVTDVSYEDRASAG